MGLYKDAILEIMKALTCPHCKKIFTRPVTLDCGDSVCWDCAIKIGSNNKAGQRCCCCPKCGAESVTEDLVSRVHLTLLDVVDVCVDTAFLGKGRSSPEACSAGDITSEGSVGSSCSISSIHQPPNMASTRELSNGMSLSTDGLESVDELSERPFGSWDCSKNKQRSEDKTSAQRSFSVSGRLCESKLQQQNALVSSRAHSMDSLTHTIPYGTQRSLYITGWHKRVLLAVLDRLTCPHCKNILNCPVILFCGHSVCWDCAETSVSKNKEGLQCCCCPQCGEESVTEDLVSRVNWTLLHVTASLQKEHSTPEACSAGDRRSECSFGSSCSIQSMDKPPFMAQNIII